MPQENFEEVSEILEAERRRVAAELERGVIEALNLLLAQTALYEQTLPTTPQTKIALAVINTLGKQALQQARALLDNLQPTILNDLGLEAALDWWAGQFSRTRGLVVTFAAQGERSRLAVATELNIFRTVQEILERLADEAKVLRLQIDLERRSGWLRIQIAHSGTTLPVLKTGPLIASEQHNGLIILTVVVETQAEFTQRELEVLGWLGEGLSNKAIAQQMQVSPRTVNFHLDNIYVKLEVNSRTEAVMQALRRGILRRPV